MQQEKWDHLVVVDIVVGMAIELTSSTLVTRGSGVAATAATLLALECSTSASTMVHPAAATLVAWCSLLEIKALSLNFYPFAFPVKSLIFSKRLTTRECEKNFDNYSIHY